MSITVNFEVASAPKRNGLYPVFLRVTENSKHYKMSLGVFVQNRKIFNPHAKYKAWIATKEPLFKVYNAKLEDILITYNETERELLKRGELTASNIIKNLKQDDSDSLISYIDKKYSQLMNFERYSSANARKDFKRYLLIFSKGKDITFNDITSSFVEDFEEFLRINKTKKNKSLHRNSINKILFMFKSIFKQATEDNLVSNNRTPFSKMKLKNLPRQRACLSVEEMDMLINLDLESDSELWHIRNYFLFSFYMAGIRVGDLIGLKWENITETHLIYRMRKTSHIQPVLLTEKSREILSFYKKLDYKQDDYVFPIMTKYSSNKLDCRKLKTVSRELTEYRRIGSRTTCLNMKLKKLAEMAGIKKNITFHVARHNFGTLITLSQGVPLETVSQMMGHKCFRTTQIYAKLTRQKINEDIKKLSNRIGQNYKLPDYIESQNE